jgi:DNA polymerase-3 subunit alpha
MLAYQTAYLKANYPAEFMAALLSTVMDNLDKVGRYIRECKEMEIKVLPPDINESAYEFVTTDTGNIRFGLKAIKNVGKNAIRSIIVGREENPYSSFIDFLERTDLGKINVKVIESLIKAGALDSLGIYRSRLLAKFEDLYHKISSSQKRRKQGQTSFFDLVEEEDQFYQNTVEYPRIDELSFDHKLAQEREYLGIYLSGHPLDKYRGQIENFTNITSQQLENIDSKNNAALAGIIVNNKEYITKRDNQMAFLTVEDLLGKAKVVVFADLYKNVKDICQPGSRILINGRVDEDSFIATNILDLETGLLEIDMNQVSVRKLEDLQEILQVSPGDIPVYFKINNKRNIIKCKQ